MAQTTRVFDMPSAVFTLLDAQTWPDISAQNPVSVALEGMGLEEALEQVIVLAAPSEPADIVDDDSLGMVRLSEQFAIRVTVSTVVDGRTMVEVIARVKLLVNVIEVALRSQVSGRPVGGFDTIISGERMAEWWFVTHVEPNYWAGTEGWYGECLVDISFRTRL